MIATAQTTLRTYVARSPAPPDPRTAGLAVTSQAALRQFGFDRLTGYGVDQADAHELHERVLTGQSWQEAASELAQICLDRVDAAPTAAGEASRIGYLRRAAALLRTSQVMMLTDTPERRAIYTRAGIAYQAAGDLAENRLRVEIDTPHGQMVGWLCPARAGECVGSAVVIGGVEGYAMDFDSLGTALAGRGIDTLLLDGPGQGETRFTHGHYLTVDWRDAYRSAVAYLDARAPGRPIGFIGNSMGGSFAMAIAAEDPRIRACCDNGGIPAPWLVPPSIGTFFTKMTAFCGTTEPAQAVAAWSSVTPLRPGPNPDYPLLVVHGGHDPLVSIEMAQAVLHQAPTTDKQMVVFSDGDHCLYNHQSDRDALIADWVRVRLGGAQPTQISC